MVSEISSRFTGLISSIEICSKIRENLLVSFEVSKGCSKFRDVLLVSYQVTNIPQRFDTTWWSLDFSIWCPKFRDILLVSFQVSKCSSKIRYNLVISFDFSTWCPKFRDVLLVSFQVSKCGSKIRENLLVSFEVSKMVLEISRYFTGLISSNEMLLKDSIQLGGLF